MDQAQRWAEVPAVAALGAGKVAEAGEVAGAVENKLKLSETF